MTTTFLASRLTTRLVAIALVASGGLALAGTGTSDPRPLKNYEAATFSADWDKAAHPLYYKRSTATRNLWEVPQAMPDGTYVIFERENGVPKIIEGLRVQLPLGTGDDTMVVPLPSWVKKPELVDQGFVTMPGGVPASSFR
jgi:hypothetical protein